jgi:hypothetical protein
VLVTQDQFTTAFPEFADATVFPAGQFSFWEQQAESQLDAKRFGTSYSLAIMLYVAHNLALSAQASRGGASAVGSAGIVTSKAVGSVSKSYDNSVTATSGAGAWNATSYGQRLLALMQSFLGPIYVPGYPRGRRFGFPYGI